MTQQAEEKLYDIMLVAERERELDRAELIADAKIDGEWFLPITRKWL